MIGTRTADVAATNGSSVSVNAASAFSDPNTGDTITYAATGLPAGLTINASTGVITGTLTNIASNGGTGGVYTIAVTATDNKGAATTESFKVTATDVAPVIVAAPANQVTTDSASVSYATAASFKNGGNETGALAYAATGLPAGLTINASTGVISGTIDHNASAGGTGGVYTISETVTDAAGVATTTSFTITSTNQAPVIGTRTADQVTTDGSPSSVDASKAFSDPNTGDVITYSATGLPTGLTINASTGVISGTLDHSASQGGTSGVYSVVVTATDNKGAATSETVKYTVTNPAPVVTAPLPDQITTDSSTVTYPTATSFKDGGLDTDTLTYSATGLPAGLTLNTSTGVISGTLPFDASRGGQDPANPGIYLVAVSANDGQGGTVETTFRIRAVGGVSERVEKISKPDVIDNHNANVAAREPVAVTGVVVDTVENAGGFGSLSGTLRADRVILDSVNQFSSLGSIGTPIDGRGFVLAEVHRIDRISQAEITAPGHAQMAEFEPRSFLGHSVEFDLLHSTDPNHAVMLDTIRRFDTIALQFRELGVSATSESLVYSLHLPDGSPAPKWLERLASNVFMGRPPSDIERLDLLVRITRQDGTVIDRPISVDVQTGNLHDRSNEAAVPVGGKIEPHANLHQKNVTLLFTQQVRQASAPPGDTTGLERALGF